MGIGLAKDRQGRVPFSMVAVLILVGSVATGAYMQQVAMTGNGGRGGPAGSPLEAMVPQLRLELEEAAGRCIAAAVEQQTLPGVDEGQQGLWRVDQNIRALFDQELRREWGGQSYDRYCLTFEAGESTLQITTVPMTLRALNRLGMAVSMTAPAGFRVAGAVNFTFTTGGSQTFQRTVDFRVERASWYPLALFQADRLRRDCVNEGLLELLFRQMFSAYLDTDFDRMLLTRNWSRRCDGMSTLTVGDLWKGRNLDGPGCNAVDLALAIEEQTLFGETRGRSFNYLLNRTGNRPLDLAAAMDHPSGAFTGAAAFRGDGGGPLLDLGPFYGGITLLPLDGRGTGVVRLPFVVGSSWAVPPQPEFRRATFAGEDVEVDVYVLEVAVNGVFRLAVGPDEDHLLRLDIPVHLAFTMDHRIHERNRAWSEQGRRHCEVEDLRLFDSEYAGLYSTPCSIVLDVTNSSGVRAQAMPGGCSVDLSLDGDYLGTFRRGDFGPDGLYLVNVPSGPHQLDAAWNAGSAAGTEHGSATVVLDGLPGTVRLTTGREDDSSPFWTFALVYIRDTPSDQRLYRLLEFISMLAGYPVPHDPGAFPGGPSGNPLILESWLDGVEGSLEQADAGPDHATGATAIVLKGARSTVKVLQEALKWMDKVNRAVDEYNRQHPGNPVSAEPTVSYTNRDGTESLVASVEGPFGKETMALDREAGAADWKVRRSGGTPGAGPREPKIDRLGAALDIAVTIAMVVAAYMKWMKYEATDGINTAHERLDLQLEAVKVVLQVTRLLVKYVFGKAIDGLAKGASAAAKLASGIGVVIALIAVVQLVSDENRKFRGDATAWEALFTGLDLDTITCYLSMTTVILGMVELCLLIAKVTVFTPILAALMALVALVLLVCVMVYDWNAFSTFVSGTLTDSDRDRMAQSIEGALRDTAGTVASLNGFPADAEMLSARQARGSASLMSGLASFVADPGMSFEMRNLSRFQYDTAWARENQARAVRSLRFFVVAMWLQVDEFGGRGWTALHPLREQSWDSRITVTWPDLQTSRIETGYIQSFLLGLDATSMEDTRIDFKITGRVVVDSLRDWMDPLSRIGDQVKLWNGRLRASQEMKAFLAGLDSADYRNDWGLLKLQLSQSYTGCNVNVTSGGLFDFRDGTASGRATVLRKAITVSDGPTYLYLEPGSYTLDFSGQRPDHGLKLKGSRATVEAVGLYSTTFGQRTINIDPRPEPIYFQVRNGFNGSIRVRAEVIDREGAVVGSLGAVLEFDNRTTLGGRQYIDDGWVPGFDFDGSMWEPSLGVEDCLSLRLLFTVELDRQSDGVYELSCTRAVHLYEIRNDHRARMIADDGKSDDQLGYHLTVLNEPFREKYGEDAGGNDLLRDQYVQWGKIA